MRRTVLVALAAALFGLVAGCVIMFYLFPLIRPRETAIRPQETAAPDEQQGPTEQQGKETSEKSDRMPSPQSDDDTGSMPAGTPSQPEDSRSASRAGEPYPDAPLCPDSGDAHDNSLFHTLWDSTRGCHYDHEHGTYPFTPEVAAAFPGFDLKALLGDVEIGHTNPSSPMENTHKHGGFKWDVTLSHSSGCAGREGAPTGIDALVIQYHGFGNYEIEFESRTHSAVGLLRQCREDNPTDYGYVFVNQLQDYGQRTAPYQGVVLSYPDTPKPAYASGLKPYFFIECMGGAYPCDKHTTLQSYLELGEAKSTWISEPFNLNGSGSHLFGLSFKVRDTYQVLDWSDQEYPFTFRWLCSKDDGMTYDPAGCRFNNSTTQIVELGGEIPDAWDNLEGFDTDERPGRVTAEGFVTQFGDLNPDCRAPGPDCHPLKLVSAFTGRYGSFVVSEKFATTKPSHMPERDIYFCGDQVCAEDDPGAVPSGWIGPNN